MVNGLSIKRRSAAEPAAPVPPAAASEPPHKPRMSLRKLFGRSADAAANNALPAAAPAPPPDNRVLRQFSVGKSSSSSESDTAEEADTIKPLENPFGDNDEGGRRKSTNFPPPNSTTTLLMTEASNKARMLRAASGMVDVEYTAAACLKGTASAKPQLPPPNSSKNKFGNAPKTAATAGLPAALTESGNASSPPQVHDSLASGSTPSKTSLHRMCSTVACPGFQDKGAENELRQALQLRKLKTKQTN